VGAFTDRLLPLVETQLETGLADGIQLVAAHYGEVVTDVATGWRHDGTPMTADTRLLLFSAAKPLVAAAVHLVVERRLVNYDDALVDYLPELGSAKSAITLRHALCHRAGMPDLERRVPLETYASWSTAVAETCALPLEFPPGVGAAYHPLSAYTLLAALVERVTATAFAGFCAAEIFEPLGMQQTSWGASAGDPSVDDTRGLDPGYEAEFALWRQLRQALIPGGNAFSTARDLCRFYLSLRPGSEGTRVLSPETVAVATRVHAPYSPNWTLGFGLGFIVGTDAADPGSRGFRLSARTFGHPGLCSVQALCDPDRDLILVALTNVGPDQQTSDARFAALCDAVADAADKT